MRGDLRLASVSLWKWFTTAWRAWALVGAGVSSLAAVIYVINIVAEERWRQALAQIDVLKILGVILALTNGVVVVAIAAVRLKAAGPAGFKFDVDSDDDSAPVPVHVEGDIEVKPGGAGQ